MLTMQLIVHIRTSATVRMSSDDREPQPIKLMKAFLCKLPPVFCLRRCFPLFPSGEEDRKRVLQRSPLLHVMGESALWLYHGRWTESVLPCEETTDRRYQTRVMSYPRGNQFLTADCLHLPLLESRELVVIFSLCDNRNVSATLVFSKRVEDF